MLNIQSYFIAEKSEALLFILIGIVALAIVFFALFIMRTSIWKGAAYPLLIIAIIQIAVGFTVYFRTDKQYNELVALFQNSKPKFIQTELPRMEAVISNFKLYKKAEVVLILIGLVLYFKMRNKNEFWYGLGIGLLIQSIFMLVLDIFAESRAEVYIAFLKAL